MLINNNYSNIINNNILIIVCVLRIFSYTHTIVVIL